MITGKKKSFTLAPFKFRFSKMKSKSNGSRGNSMESAEPISPILNPGQILNGTGGTAEANNAEGNCLAVRNETAIPSSPPPSYEHVLEETRLQQTTMSCAQAMGTSGDGMEAACNEIERTPAKGPEILHKSSKEFYKAVAKQWGITCKMSDHCRCFDCQSHYFDCEYEKEEHDKTDGGLGAGTPMFLSEMMHGTSCSIL